jgi:hypothetical protein
VRSSLLSEFYSIVPAQKRDELVTAEAFEAMMETVQLLKDMIGVHLFSLSLSLSSRYRDTDRFVQVNEVLAESNEIDLQYKALRYSIYAFPSIMLHYVFSYIFLSSLFSD